jgi:hypothetical protein
LQAAVIVGRIGQIVLDHEIEDAENGAIHPRKTRRI